MRRFFDRQTIHEFSDEEIMLELCRRIRLLRQGSGISQTDMANEAGISLSTVRRIESGDAGNVTLATLLKILLAGGRGGLGRGSAGSRVQGRQERLFFKEE